MFEALTTSIDGVLSPATVFLGSLVVLETLLWKRHWFARPRNAVVMLVLSILFLAASLCDADFAAVALAPDNVAIIAMLYLFGFFTWLATAQAVQNDLRSRLGEPLSEERQSRRFFTWPDLVYSELICMIAAMAILLVWSLLVPAPLEASANPTITPNPSKAPWYFLGLQELLFYSDAWLAGVVVPCLIVVGLMAIPYLDKNPDGSGFYTIERRPLAYALFQFGLWQLWILLILVGTFLRGPNWAFFGLYEPRDSTVLAPIDDGSLPPIVGIGILTAYFVGVPLLLSATLWRDLRHRMGAVRFAIFVVLALLMFALPLKMLLQWTFHVRHIL